MGETNRRSEEKAYLDYLADYERFQKTLTYKQRWGISFFRKSKGNFINYTLYIYNIALTIILLALSLQMPNLADIIRSILGIGGLWLVFFLWKSEISFKKLRLMLAIIPLAIVYWRVMAKGYVDLSSLTYIYALMVYGGVYLIFEELFILSGVVLVFQLILITDGYSMYPNAGDVGSLVAAITTGWFIKGMVSLYYHELKLQDELKYRYEHDEITGLINRAQILNLLDQKINNKESFSLIIANLHNYRGITQHFGPKVGDGILKRFAEFFQCQQEEGWVLASFAPGEIIIVIPGDENVESVIQKLREAQKGLSFEIGSDSLPIYAEYGWIVYPCEARSVHELIQLAEQQKMVQLIKTAQGGSQWDQKLSDLYTNVRWNLFETLSTKDVYTRIHSESVANYLIYFNNFLGLNFNEKDLWRAGILHDIGKIAIPDRILKKPAHLTREEYRVMMQHPQIGHDIINYWVKSNPLILSCVLEHHERWDGTGYPHGKKGKEISLIGRMAAIVDAYSAMTLDRTYHRGCLPEEALEQIENGAGTQFDPELAQEFIKMVRNIKPQYLNRIW